MNSAPSAKPVQQDIDRISAVLTKLLDEAEDILRSTVDGADRKIDTAEHKSRETLRRVCGHLRNARSELIAGVHKIDGTVHSHPWRAVAVTAVVSFLAGLLVRRR